MEKKTRTENDDKYLHNWLHSTPEFVFFKDLDGTYQAISDSILKLVKKKNIAEVIGKSDFEIYPDEVAKNFVEEDRIIKETQINYLCEDWVEHETLGKILIETLKAPVYDENEELIGVQGISRNITEKHIMQKKIMEKEAQLRAILKNIPMMIWIKDVEGNYLDANKKYRETFFPHDTKLTGEGVYENLYSNNLATPDVLKELRRLDDEVIADHKTVKMLMPSTINSQKRWIEIIKTPLILDDGSFYGVLGMGLDITENKNYNEMMRRAKEKAEEAAKVKADFLANISHEIRTPMNGIMGFIQLLEGTHLNEEQKDYVREIVKSSESLLTLLNNVLDLSKAEAGKLTLEHIPFNVRDVIEDVAVLASSSIKDKKIELFNYVDTNIIENLIGDKEKLRQVLNNFVNNAVKFTQDGEIHINAKFRSRTQDTIEILFEVEDTGIGIKEENLEKIFESFTQEDESTTRRFGGTGLGLAISKNIIEKMGGYVKVRSHYGIGSKFMFSAKFEIDHEFEETHEPLILGDKKLLLLEKNQYRATIIREYLRQTNIQIDEATSVNQALEFLNNDNQYDAIIVNYKLKDENPLRFIEQVKAQSHTKDIPIIVSISRFENNIFENKGRYEISKFLLEPVRLRDLINTLTCVIEV